MKLSPQTLTLGPVPYGQQQSAQHTQFGEVTLKSDGRVDDSFAHGYQGLNDDSLRQFLAAESALSNRSLAEARQNFEAGHKVDSSKVSEEHYAQLKQTLSDCGLKGSVHPTTDWRGVVTSCSVHLGEVTEARQFLSIDNLKSSLELKSFNGQGGTHIIRAPLSADGSPAVGEATEQMSLSVPWLNSKVVEYQGKGAIVQMDDPRLERITQAAELGFHLPAGELGPGWKSSVEGQRQTWKLESGDEKIVIDSSAHSAQISASGWGSFGEHDYQVSSNILFQNGKFSQI